MLSYVVCMGGAAVIIRRALYCSGRRRRQKQYTRSHADPRDAACHPSLETDIESRTDQPQLATQPRERKKTERERVYFPIYNTCNYNTWQ